MDTLIHILMFNTVPEGQKHQESFFVQSFHMWDEAENACITLNAMHAAEPSFGNTIGELDFYYIKSYKRKPNTF